jgi:erythromycin esterase
MSEARLSEMMALFSQATAEQSEAKRNQAYNLREEVNAENLLWLAEDYFAGKKVLVWAHNLHISACGPAGTEEPGTRLSMGTLVKQRLGDQAYALGVVGYQGQWAWLDNPPIAYAAAPPDSLEEAWGQAGMEKAFVDLRGCRGDGHWLMQPRSGYLDQQAAEQVMVRWPLVYDGVVFFREMTPRVGLPTGK